MTRILNLLTAHPLGTKVVTATIVVGAIIAAGAVFLASATLEGASYEMVRNAIVVIWFVGFAIMVARLTASGSGRSC